MLKKKQIKPLRIAIIGCGWFGNFHMDKLLKMEGVEITALYNRGIENLEKAGKKVPNARMYQDAQQMLKKEKLDAAVVSLTPGAHGNIEELCCKKGIHLFVEKPIELSISRAAEIKEAISFSGIISSVGYQERYSPPVELVKEILEKEPAGLVQGYWIGEMPGPKWWRTKAESGGQLVEQATHIVDIFRYLFGEVDSVFSSGRRDQRFGGPEHDVEDYSTTVLNFKSGVMASVQTGCYTKNGGAGKAGFDIFTPRCTISYRWGESLRVSSGERSEEIKVLGDNHIPAMESFIEAVRSGDRLNIKSSYEDAFETLKVTLLANESMKARELIKISQ